MKKCNCQKANDGLAKISTKRLTDAMSWYEKVKLSYRKIGEEWKQKRKAVVPALLLAVWFSVLFEVRTETRKWRPVSPGPIFSWEFARQFTLTWEIQVNCSGIWRPRLCNTMEVGNDRSKMKFSVHTWERCWIQRKQGWKERRLSHPCF